MSEKPGQRRGLGRGLGSLIPTGPRPQPPGPDGMADGRSQAVQGTGLAVLDAPASGGDQAGGQGWSGDARPAESTPDVATGSGEPDGGAPGTAEAGHEEAGHGQPGHGQSDHGQSDHGQSDHGQSDHGQSEHAEPGHVGQSRAEPGPEESGAGEGAAGEGAAGEPAHADSGPEEQGAGEAPGPGAVVAASSTGTGAWFAELPVHDIRPNPRQPREVFDEDAMAELVHSISEVGLLQPVVVRPLDDNRFELVMGERRWRATQQAGLQTIPAIVRETGDEALLRDALLENLHRAELNALEEAAAYAQLLEDFDCTHDELAARLGRSRPQISNTIRLLKLSPAVQRRVAAGVLSAGHARALLGVQSPDAQDRLAARVVAEGISVRSLEEMVAVGDLDTRPVAPRHSRPTAPGADHLAARLSDRLDTRVRVDIGRRKGRVSIEFASLADLERIVTLIDPSE